MKIIIRYPSNDVDKIKKKFSKSKKKENGPATNAKPKKARKKKGKAKVMKRKTTTATDPVEGKKTKGKKQKKGEDSNRSFNRYIQKVFKRCIPVPPPEVVPAFGTSSTSTKKKKTAKYCLAAETVTVLNEFNSQMHDRIIADWKKYSQQNNKRLMSEDDIAEIFNNLFVPHHPRPQTPLTWSLQTFATKAVEDYKDSIPTFVPQLLPPLPVPAVTTLG